MFSEKKSLFELVLGKPTLEFEAPKEYCFSGEGMGAKLNYFLNENPVGEG